MDFVSPHEVECANWSQESVLSYLFSSQTFISEMILLQRQSTSVNWPLDLEQVNILRQGLLSAKSQIENYLSFEIDQYLSMDMALVMQFRHSVQMIYRLSLLKNPDWERVFVGDIVDVIECLEQATQRLEQASKIITSMGNSAAHGAISKVLRGLRASLPTRDAILDQQQGAFPGDMEIAGALAVEADNVMSWSTKMGCMEDDTWLTEAILASYGCDN